MLLGKESSPDLLSHTIISVPLIPKKAVFLPLLPPPLTPLLYTTDAILQTHAARSGSLSGLKPAKKREEGWFNSDGFPDQVYSVPLGRFAAARGGWCWAAAQGKASSARLGSKQLQKYGFIYPSAKAHPRLGKK